MSGSEQLRRFEDQYRRNPDSLVFARLADAHRKAGDPERALTILEDGMSRHPDYASAHIVRARCLLDLDRRGDADASLRRVLELDGQNLVAMRGLASLAEERGDPDEAVRWYERISSLDPTNVEADVALERLRASGAGSGAPGPAISGLEPLPAPVEEFWSTPGAADAAAGAAEVPGEPDTAAAADDAMWWFEDPDDDEAADEGDLLTRTMAELYAQQGLIEEAAAIYRELLHDRPDDPELLAALDRIERDDGEEGPAGRESSPDHQASSPGREDAASGGDEPASGGEGVSGPRALPAERPAVPAGDPATPPDAERAGRETSAAAAPDEADAAAAPDEADAVGSPAPEPAPAADPYATHEVPGRAGTSELARTWVRRLAE